MRTILMYLMVLVGANQMLARTLYWNNYDDNYNMWAARSHFHDELYKFLKAESAEEVSRETVQPFTNNNEDEILLSNFFSSFLSPILPTQEENADSKENLATASVKLIYVSTNDQNNDDDDDNEQSKKTDTEQENNEFVIHLSHIFGSEEQKSSEEKNNMDEEKEELLNKSSEETKSSSFKEDASEEKSSEVQASRNTNVEIVDVEKSSEENKSDDDMNISEKDMKDLTYFLMTLNILDDLSKVADYAEDEERSDELKSKEVDQFLELLTDALDKAMAEELDAKKNNKNENENDNFVPTEKESAEADSSEDNNSTTAKYESSEDDDENTKTATYDSDESNEIIHDDKYDNNDSNNSDSNENDSNPLFFVFHGLDDTNEQTKLNDHKYELVDDSSLTEFHPTTAPLQSESMSTPNFEELSVMHQYSDIRKDIDTQQITLQKNEDNLDKDFYTLIKNNYDEESLKNFENDIYMVHEDLDRIKRNINEMQNFHSKLYFHKLITAAIQKAQNKGKH